VIRLEARGKPPAWVNVAVPLGSIALAMVVAGIVLVVTGNNPFTTYQNIVRASITQPGAFEQTLISMTPLLLTGLAAAVAFRMRVWNIGGEGQLYMGAIGAAGIGLFLHSLPAPVVVLAMVVGGIIAGSLWAAIPGALRAYLNTNEILTSLMLNYVAVYVMYYLIYDSTSYWRDLSSAQARVFPSGKYLEASGNWPGLQLSNLVIPLGLMIAVGLAVALWFMIRSTRYGFEMRVLGDSPRTAQYAGIKTRRKILSVMMLSGGIAGLAGVSQVGDFNHVLDPRGLQGAGFGYTGIVVAALARYNPLAVVLTSFLIGAITNAGFALQGPNFPTGLTGTLEGILLFCVLGAELFIRYRIRWRPTREVPPARRPGSPITEPALATGGPAAGETP
jgi:simple sugar transport system permease protein